MIKKIHSFIVLLMFTQKLFAIGFQIDIGGGYGFPAARDNIDASYEVDSSGEIIKWKDVHGSYGNGIKLDIDATLFLNDYLGIMLSTGFSMLGGYKVEWKYALVELNSLKGTEDYNWESKANYLPITLGIKLRGGNSKIIPYAYVAPGIIIPIGVKGTYSYKFAGEDTISSKDTIITYNEDITEKYQLGFVISSGVGALFKISNSIGIKLEFAPTYASARLKEVTFKYELDGAPYTETLVFKKDAAKLPDPKVGDDYEIFYVRGAPYYSFSSIAAKIGIVFRF